MATLINGRRLATNTFWNLLGTGLPLLAGIVTIPFLIRGLGIDRFGILTLAWVVIGYLGLLDLGVGRALTKLIAEKLGAGDTASIPVLTWSALTLMAVLGVISGVLLAIATPWLGHNLLEIPPALQQETLKAFYLLAISIPIVMITSGLRGVLEAYQRFGWVNALRIPMGLFTFIGPLVVLPFSNSLPVIVAVLVAGRVVALMGHVLMCVSVVPELKHRSQFQFVLIQHLLSFGGWMTVSNIISPLMVYFDRFLIAAIISVAAVAYYVTPYEVVTRLLIISGSITGVLFPAFAAILVEDNYRVARLFERGVKFVCLTMFPTALLIITFAMEALDLWVGPDIAQNSTLVLQWLVIGVFVNSFAQIPFALVQGRGRPDLTAKLHLLELPFYLLLLLWLINLYGITGAAIAWTVRAIVDTVFLFLLAAHLIPETKRYIKQTVFTITIPLLILAIGGVISGQHTVWPFLMLALPIFVISAWFLVLVPEERAMIRHGLKFNS